MKSLIIFITSYVYVCVCLSNVHEIKCPGPNEYYNCGGACDNVCETLHIMNQTHCPIVNIKCNEMCYCNEGYARDANNICVPFKDCQPSRVKQDRRRRKTSLKTKEIKCPGPNEYYDCGGACDNVCETLHIMNQTHCPIVNIKCNEMCYCNEGYARDANNICVPFKECQPSRVKQDRWRRETSLKTKVPPCGLNEEYKSCTCPPDTCIFLIAQIKCGPCVPGCACRDGYLRQTAEEPCRPIRKCRELANSPDFN